MKLHIFTLTWNGEDKLRKLYPSLANQLPHIKNKGIETHWHVRDNGSKDKSISYVEQAEALDNITVLEVGHNRASFAEGMNSLANQADVQDDDYILLLNNDIVFDKDNSLLKMIDLMDKTKAGVVGARLLYPNTNRLQHAGVIFSERYNGLPFHYRPNEESDEAAEKNRYFQAVTAACALVRGSSWNRVGGMDQSYNWAFEDIDLCLSIGEKEKIVYCGKTKIFHEESASLKKNPVHKMFMNQNVAVFKKKWQGKYKLDLELYEQDSNYNEAKI